MTEPGLIERSTDHLVTKTTLRKTISPDIILKTLKTLKTSGNLNIALMEGGIRSITLEEQTKPLSEPESESVRQVLGMD